MADRAAFQAGLDALRIREKAHTREGDAIAAARRRLPMVEVDATIPLTGPHGPVTLLETFEGRRQLIAYYLCHLLPGAICGERPVPRIHGLGHALVLRTNGGPPAWPAVPAWPGGRPIAQWSRLEAGHSDDLGT